MKKDAELADSCQQQQQQQQQQQGHDQECRPPPHDHHTSCSSSCSLHDHQNDRNFDDLKDLFKERIYGTVKGQYRISMIIEDIESQLAAPAAQQGKQLRQKEEREQKKMQLQNDSCENGLFFFKALDIGGGLGQMTLHFATSGRFRQVDYFDISQKMKTHVDLKIAEARERGELQLTSSSSSLEQGQEEVSICTRLGGLQDAISISSNNSKTASSIRKRGEELLLPDVVCLHAVLEWLANPMRDLEDLLHYMKNGSILSLLYYNKLRSSSSSSSSDGGQNRQQDGPKRKQRTRKCKKPSPLTPYHEFSHDEIEDKLVQCGFEITIRTGLRVKKFHPKTKSNDNDDLIKYLEHERTIARTEPYYWQGRYNHVVAVKIASSKGRE